MLGEVVGSRFRVLFSTEDTTQATSQVTGTKVTEIRDPIPYQSVVYTAAEDGYLTITKDNAGTAGIQTYLFVLDEMTTMAVKVITENGIYRATDDNVDGYSQVSAFIISGGVLTPIVTDLDTGYITNGTWVPGGSTVTYTDVYKVYGEQRYFLALDEQVGTRFRAMFSTQNISQTSSQVKGTNIINVSDPSSYQATIYTAPSDGYISITKDNDGVAGLRSYVIDLSERQEDSWQSNLQEKIATANGEVVPDEGYSGLSKVIVAVPNSVVPSERPGLTPIIENGTGMVNDGVYNGSLTGTTDIFQVERDQEYLILLGNNVSDVFRVMFAANTQDGVQGDSIINNEDGNEPQPNSMVFYTPESDGYIFVTKSTASVSDVLSYCIRTS